jgi:hypothetical protein
LFLSVACDTPQYQTREHPVGLCWSHRSFRLWLTWSILSWRRGKFNIHLTC